MKANIKKEKKKFQDMQKLSLGIGLVVVLVAILILGKVFIGKGNSNDKSNKESKTYTNSKGEEINHVEKKKGKYTCTYEVTIPTDSELVIERELYFDDNSLENFYGTATYKFGNKDDYERMQDSLLTCIDNYKDSREVICEAPINEEEEELIGKNIDEVLEKLKEQGYECSKN